MFLMGPVNQVKRMFDSQRWISTAVYLITLVMTMVSALVFHSVSHACLLVRAAACRTHVHGARMQKVGPA
jgi:hypothetical protein